MILKNQLHVIGITDLNAVKNQWSGRPIMSMDDANVVEVHMTTLSYQCVIIEQITHMLELPHRRIVSTRIYVILHLLVVSDVHL
jgi:hypothetical protein